MEVEVGSSGSSSSSSSRVNRGCLGILLAIYGDKKGLIDGERG